MVISLQVIYSCDRDKIPEQVGTVISKQVFSRFLCCSFKFFLFLTKRGERQSISLLIFQGRGNYLKGKVMFDSVILAFFSDVDFFK